MIDDDPVQLVLRALAHPVRRRVLESLLSEAGLSIADLLRREDLTRQTLVQHLDALIDADLVRTEYEGRERLHYLNVVPIVELMDGWMAQFATPQVRALLGLPGKVEAAQRDAEVRGKPRRRA